MMRQMDYIFSNFKGLSIIFKYTHQLIIALTIFEANHSLMPHVGDVRSSPLIECNYPGLLQC